MYDIIGDIHGHADALVLLLRKMGYENKNGYYYHPSRKAIFTGDFIDRGPFIRKTIDIVKSMLDNGAAHAVMGNHEYNAICYYTKDRNGLYLREHSKKNIKQFRHTLRAFKSAGYELLSHVKWFMTLPVFFEQDGLRVVHACWDYKGIEYIKKKMPSLLFDFDMLIESSKKETETYDAINIILKGKEIRLPKSSVYYDKEGTARKSVRMKWWANLNSETYRSIAVNYDTRVPDSAVPHHFFSNHRPYSENEPPVFLGHYWQHGIPKTFASNVCCVDYSVAKNGKLVAYRWDGEKNLNDNKFIYLR